MAEYRPFVEQFLPSGRTVFFAFIVVAILSFFSFGAFDIYMISQLFAATMPNDNRIISIIIFALFLTALQLVLGSVTYLTLKSERPLFWMKRLIMPLALLSLPFGIVTYVELTKLPPEPTHVSY